MGTIGDQVCCSGKIFDVVPRDVNKTECCNGEGYDPRFFICCDVSMFCIYPPVTGISLRFRRE